MVPGLLPTETARVSLNLSKTMNNPHLVRGKLVKMAKPSPDRVIHPCPHFEKGCPASPLGIMDYAAQLNWKRNHTLQTMRRIGGMETDIPPVIPSPLMWNYRDRIELHVANVDNRWYLGYAAGKDIIGIECCHLTVTHVQSTIPKLTSSLSSTLSKHAQNGSFRLLLRDNFDGGVVCVVYLSAEIADYAGAIQRALNKVDLAGWEIHLVPNVARRQYDSNLLISGGDPGLKLRFSRFTVTASPLVFTQANQSLASLLVKSVVECLPLGGLVIDMFCGYAPFALEFAAEHKGHAVAIDTSASALQAGQTLAKMAELPIRFIRNDLSSFNAVMMELSRAEAIILDPPRSGLSRGLCKSLSRRGPKSIIYVSCHPAAFARDAKLLDGYTIKNIRLLDMFPQTPDVELVATLESK